MASVFTEQNENYMRLVLLINDKGTEASQECLHHFSTRHYGVGTFDEVLQKAEAKLRKYKGAVNLKHYWKLLYPGTGIPVETKQLDITLCFALIRITCGLNEPVTTWNEPPAPTDQSVEGSLAQLKCIRNFLSHNKPQLSDNDFKTHVDNAVDAILNIERNIPSWTLTQSELMRYKIQPISLVQEKELLEVVEKWGQLDLDLRREIQDTKYEVTNLKEPLISIHKNVSMICENIKRVGPMNNTLQKGLLSQEAYASELIRELQGFYQRSMENIQCDPLNPRKTMPLKDLVVNLMLVRGCHQSSTYLWKLKHYREMFASDKKKRILVQGSAGIGKTIFGKVLVYDWSHGNEPCLERFESVFLLQMRFVKPEQSLVDIIEDQLLRRRPDLVEGLKDYIENNDKCLLIFDGLDELGKTRSPEIEDIINGFYLRDAFILFTSRPWLVQDLVATDQGVDQHYRIDGFDRDDVRIFIEKLFANFSIAKQNHQDFKETSSKLLTQIKNKNLLDLVAIPLILNMICLFFHHEKKLPNTVSKLYKGIMELLYKQSSKRSNTKHTNDFHEILLKLGKLAFGGLLKENSQLFFEYDEVIDLVGERAFEIGFISCAMVKDRMGDDTQLQFLHKSFQEYLAAYYVSIEFENENEKPWEELKKEMKTVKELRNKAILIEFLAGESEIIALSVQNYLDEMIIEAFCNANDYSYGFVDDIDACRLLYLQTKCLRNMKSTKHPDYIPYYISCDEELSKFVQSSNSLAWICMRKIHFTEKTVELIRETLDKNDRCVSVYIGSSRGGEIEVITHLVEVIKSHSKVKYKYLSLGQHFRLYQVKGWKQFFQELLGIERLLGLVLCNCGIPSESLPILGAIINTNADTLYKLDLSGNSSIKGNFDKLSNEIMTKDDLVLSSLNLSYCILPSDAPHLASFLKKTNHLKYFDLSECECKVTESLIALRKLRIIHLSGEYWGDVIVKLLHGMEMLEEFNATSSMITDSQLETLDIEKCLKLRVLTLKDVMLSHKVLTQLAEKCKKNMIKGFLEEYVQFIVRSHHPNRSPKRVVAKKPAF